MQSEQPEYPVPWRTKEYVDVAVRSRELGCQAPVGIALLPGNFATAVSRAEFRYHEIAPQVRQAWRRIGLIDTGPGWKLRPKAATAASDGSSQDVPLAVFFGVDLASDSARPVFARTQYGRLGPDFQSTLRQSARCPSGRHRRTPG